MNYFQNLGIPIFKEGSGIHIKKKNKGKFTASAKKVGESVQEYAHNVVNNPNATTLQKKRAQFAINAKKWKHQEGGTLQPYQIDKSQPQILQRYLSLINQGIKPQAAFDSSHLSLIEDGRPNKYYSFGKRANTLDGWTKNATDSLTNGRYKNLQNSTNFNSFKQGLKKMNYNTRPAFYNTEIGKDRDKHKQIVNQYNQAHGLPLIAGINTQLNDIG